MNNGQPPAPSIKDDPLEIKIGVIENFISRLSLVDEFVNFRKKTQDDLSSLHALWGKEFQSFLDFREEVKKGLQEIFTANLSFQDRFDSVQERVERIASDQQKNLTKALSHDALLINISKDLEEMKKRFSLEIKNINEKLLCFFEEQTAFENKLKGAESKIQIQCNEMEEQKKFLQDVQKEGRRLAITVDSQKINSDSQVQKVSDSMAEIEKRGEEKINEILKVVISKLKEMEDKFSSISFPEVLSKGQIEKMIDEKVQVFILEAKNSASRSSNSEMKLSLLEKKLEQIHLEVQRVFLTR
jgi:hypothetical protein